MSELHNMLKYLTTLLLIIVLQMPSAYCIHITASGGEASESGSVSLNVGVDDEAAVNSQIGIDGADISPTTSIKGKTKIFEQTHEVADSSGKNAQVYVKVVNALNGLTYSSKVLPKKGKVKTQPEVSAEQWLTVPQADYIQCIASSSYGALSADVGIEEVKGSLPGDYVALTGYYGKAHASATQVGASQTATDGIGGSIHIYGSSNDGSESGPLNIDTSISSIIDLAARFRDLDASSYAGTTTKVLQKEHINGQFISTASSDTATKTRSSNYGNEFDLDMQAVKGSAPTGVLGYYIDGAQTWQGVPMTIQGGVNAAESGDKINVAAGIYKENIQIDKSLTLKGAGAGNDQAKNTIVDGGQAGSVFTIGLGTIVDLSGMAIQNGNAARGGGIDNFGTLTVADCIITGNNAKTMGGGGGIWNQGGKLTVTGCTIAGNNAEVYGEGGGIGNKDGTLTVADCIITGNNVGINGGGGGIWNQGGTLTVKDSTISANAANYNGGGILNDDGIATISGSTISKNSAQWGGGICNWDASTLTVEGDTTISENTAVGGGIFNRGGSITVKDSSILRNKGSEGGGIQNYGTATISGSTISGNVAAIGWGGGIYNLGIATVEDCIISENQADEGGGIFNSGIATVTGSTVSKNIGQGGGGGIFNNYAATLTVQDSTISENTVIADYQTGGGGIYNSGTATVIGSTISGNTANLGAGIFNGASTTFGSHVADLTVTDSTISGNIADYGGGGILNGYWGLYGYDGITTLTGETVISGNTAQERGGGIYNFGTVNMDGGSINNNTAQQGGGIFNFVTVNLNSGSISISGNSAGHWETGRFIDGQGGGIFNCDTVTGDISLVTGNSPDNIYTPP